MVQHYNVIKHLIKEEINLEKSLITLIVLGKNVLEYMKAIRLDIKDILGTEQSAIAALPFNKKALEIVSKRLESSLMAYVEAMTAINHQIKRNVAPYHTLEKPEAIGLNEEKILTLEMIVAKINDMVTEAIIKANKYKMHAHDLMSDGAFDEKLFQRLSLTHEDLVAVLRDYLNVVLKTPRPRGMDIQ